MAEEKEYFALITGASAGIGKAVAEELAGRGRNLFLVSLPGTGLQDFCKSLAVKYSIRAICHETDLIKPESIAAIKRFTALNDININILVNNVGIGTGGEIGTYTDFAVEETICLNLRCATQLINIYLDELKSCPRSFILNIGSFSGFAPLPFKGIYSASKAYIYNLTLSLRDELSGTSVSASVAMPGLIVTNETVRLRMAQTGLKSRITALEPNEAAKEIITQLLKGKPVIITGNSYKFIYAFANLLPFGLLRPLIRNIFRGVN